MRTLDAGAHVTAVACPALVPLIESDDPFGAETVAAVREYGAPLKEAGVDTVLMGMSNDTDEAVYPQVAELVRQVEPLQAPGR